MSKSTSTTKEKPKDTRAFPPFNQSLPMALMRARDAAMLHFRPVLASAELTEQQWRVMRALYDEGATDISSLAKTCHILLPSMSGILKRLEARALIKRKANQEDQRSSLILITSKAKRLIEELAPQLEQRYQEIEQKIGKEQLDDLYKLLFELEAKLNSAT